MLAWLLDSARPTCCSRWPPISRSWSPPRSGSGAGESLSDVLLNSAAQERIDDAVLGRVIGLISFVHRGSHGTGLLLVAPIFAIAAARPIFAVSAFAVAAVAVGGAVVAARLARGPAPAPV